MNIIEFSEDLQTKMKQELANLNTDQDEIIQIGKGLTSIRELISELKTFTRHYKFGSQAEEIQFFKEVKPVFLSQYFYYKKVFAIRLFDSFKDAKSRQANYYHLLRQLEGYVEKNFEFYQYCMSGNSFLDAHYFTRSSQGNKSLDRDESFSTGYDTRLAKILANELLKNLVLKLLNRTDAVQPELTWTGSKTDLIELIYALHGAEIFNNGSIDIKKIAASFESVFNTSLGNFYKTFQEIRIRKKNQASFLDHLKTNLVKRMNSGDEK
ncbi:MAG TPA: RteC domain-containing protein [Cyclobacteriaceae bacterium]|nr:RteC domain-containing protein [Cyclobacteriaceae bacterium]HRF32973.1 RteC domain-containing protein [Cyclobacteriaceae bacterium]